MFQGVLGIWCPRGELNQSLILKEFTVLGGGIWTDMKIMAEIGNMKAVKSGAAGRRQDGSGENARDGVASSRSNSRTLF